MLFSKKKLRHQTEQMKTQFFNALREQEASYEAAQKIEEIGERYLALKAVEESMNDFSMRGGWKINERIYKNTKNNTELTGYGGMATLAASLGLAVVFANPFLLAGMMAAPFVAIGGGAIGDRTLPPRDEKIVTEIMADYKAAAEALSQKVTDAQSAIMTTQFREMVESPKFDEVCTKFPAVGSAFAKHAKREKLFDIAPPAVEIKILKKG